MKCKNNINLDICCPDLPLHPSVIKSIIERDQQSWNTWYYKEKVIPALRNAFTIGTKNGIRSTLTPKIKDIVKAIGLKEGI